MQDTEFFAATAKAKVGSRHGVSIAAERDRSFVMYAKGGGAWRHQVVFLFLAVATMGKRYVGIVVELAGEKT